MHDSQRTLQFNGVLLVEASKRPGTEWVEGLSPDWSVIHPRGQRKGAVFRDMAPHGVQDDLINASVIRFVNECHIIVITVQVTTCFLSAAKTYSMNPEAFL